MLNIFMKGNSKKNFTKKEDFSRKASFLTRILEGDCLRHTNPIDLLTLISDSGLVVMYDDRKLPGFDLLSLASRDLIDSAKEDGCEFPVEDRFWSAYPVGSRTYEANSRVLAFLSFAGANSSTLSLGWAKLYVSTGTVRDLPTRSWVSERTAPPMPKIKPPKTVFDLHTLVPGLAIVNSYVMFEEFSKRYPGFVDFTSTPAYHQLLIRSSNGADICVRLYRNNVTNPDKQITAYLGGPCFIQSKPNMDVEAYWCKAEATTIEEAIERVIDAHLKLNRNNT